jgi:hypothetical protein
MSPAMTAFAAEVTRAHREALHEEDRLRERWFGAAGARRDPVKTARASAKQKLATRSRRQTRAR